MNRMAILDAIGGDLGVEFVSIPRGPRMPPIMSVGIRAEYVLAMSRRKSIATMMASANPPAE
jgi:hypothetical protein